MHHIHANRQEAGTGSSNWHQVQAAPHDISLKKLRRLLLSGLPLGARCHGPGAVDDPRVLLLQRPRRPGWWGWPAGSLNLRAEPTKLKHGHGRWSNASCSPVFSRARPWAVPAGRRPDGPAEEPVRALGRRHHAGQPATGGGRH
jgi:hypothetical protein